MIRSLKKMMLALLALIALSAIGASASQAALHTRLSNTGGLSPTTIRITPDGTTTTAHQVLDTPSNGAITCKKLEGEATLPAASQESVRLENITYGECIFLGQPATLKMNGCKYNFSNETAAGTVKLECTGTNKPEFEAAGCNISFNAGQDLTGVTYTNIGTSPVMEVTVSVAINNITGIASGAGCLATGAFTTGQLTTGNVILTGETPGTSTMTPITVD